MPAANTVTLTGYIVGTPEPAQEGDRRPGKFRMNTYCSGSKAKDNLKRAFLTVKSFDNETIRNLSTDEMVKVVGRFDPWQNKDDKQMLDVMVETFDGTEHGMWNVDRDGNIITLARMDSADSYDDEEY